MHKVGPRPSLQCAVHVRENTLVLEIDIMASSIFPTSTHYSFDGCTSNVMILRGLHRAIFIYIFGFPSLTNDFQQPVRIVSMPS